MIPLDAPTWSLERTQEEIARLLPPGWRFLFGQRDKLHHAVLKDAEGNKVWEFADPAANLALFEAFSYLSFNLSSKRAAAHMNWRPTSSRVLPGFPSVPSLSTTPEEIEDLDPSEIKKMYSGVT